MIVLQFFFFFFVALAWPFVTIFVIGLQKELTRSDYILQFLNYSVVGIISAFFLLFFLQRAQEKFQRIYILVGYIVTIPWVYIFFYYLNFWINPIILCLITSFIPVIGAFIGGRLGKNN